MLDLTPGQLAIVKSVLNRCVQGRRVLAFGSRTTGKAQPFSDLDLVILGDAPLDLAQLGELRAAFADSDLPMKVDVVDGTRPPPWLAATLRTAVALA